MKAAARLKTREREPQQNQPDFIGRFFRQFVRVREEGVEEFIEMRSLASPDDALGKRALFSHRLARSYERRHGIDDCSRGFISDIRKLVDLSILRIPRAAVQMHRA